MRTTLKIDDDVLNAARALAEAQGKTIGEVISELARKGLRLGTDRILEHYGFRERAQFGGGLHLA